MGGARKAHNGALEHGDGLLNGLVLTLHAALDLCLGILFELLEHLLPFVLAKTVLVDVDELGKDGLDGSLGVLHVALVHTLQALELLNAHAVGGIDKATHRAVIGIGQRLTKAKLALNIGFAHVAVGMRQRDGAQEGVLLDKPHGQVAHVIRYQNERVDGSTVNETSLAGTKVQVKEELRLVGHKTGRGGKQTRRHVDDHAKRLGLGAAIGIVVVFKAQH